MEMHGKVKLQILQNIWDLTTLAELLYPSPKAMTEGGVAELDQLVTKERNLNKRDDSINTSEEKDLNVKI